jgi:hypothetical protein
LGDGCKHGNCDFGTSDGMLSVQLDHSTHHVAFIQKRLQGSNDDVNMDNVHRVESCLMWLKQLKNSDFESCHVRRG